MASLTRWVLAHKRIVVAFWIAATVAGVFSAGPATRALTQELSVPDKEGSVTNVEIAKRYGGTGGEAVPLLPVVTLPAGKTVESPGVRRDLAKVDATLEQALPGARIASLCLDRRPRLRLEGRPHRVRARLPDRGGRGGLRQQQRRGADGERGAQGRDGRRASPSTSRASTRCEVDSGGSEGPGVLAEAIIGGVGALVVLLFVFASVAGGRADPDGVVGDPDHVRAAARAHRADRRSRRSSSSSSR